MNNENIKVSIITPSYNQGCFIEETILSVLNQSYKNIEYILVDGGSTDNTMDIVNKYRDKIDIVISERDKGQSDAISKGFGLSTGVLAGWINSDDLLYPDCVEKIVKLYLENPAGSIYYPSSLDFIDGNGRFLYSEKKKITGKDYLLNINYEVVQQGSFYNTRMLKEVGYVDESIHYCMDLDLWLRLLDHGGIYYYEGKSLSAFRFWEQTKTHLGLTDFLKEIEQTLHKYGAKKISKSTRRLYWIRFCVYGGRLKRFFLFRKEVIYE